MKKKYEKSNESSVRSKVNKILRSFQQQSYLNNNGEIKSCLSFEHLIYFPYVAPRFDKKRDIKNRNNKIKQATPTAGVSDFIVIIGGKCLFVDTKDKAKPNENQKDMKYFVEAYHNINYVYVYDPMLLTNTQLIKKTNEKDFYSLLEFEQLINNLLTDKE